MAEIDKYFHLYGTKDEIVFEEISSPIEQHIRDEEFMKLHSKASYNQGFYDCVKMFKKEWQKQNIEKWKRLMMYLADLQLIYSPNWGANGCGDEKIYEFVTGLIKELEGWKEGDNDES